MKTAARFARLYGKDARCLGLKRTCPQVPRIDIGKCEGCPWLMLVCRDMITGEILEGQYTKHPFGGPVDARIKKLVYVDQFVDQREQTW